MLSSLNVLFTQSHNFIKALMVNQGLDSLFLILDYHVEGLNL